MASLLEQTTVPTRGVSLTSGVNYFGDVGQRRQVSFPEAQRQPQQQPQAPLRPPQNLTPAAPSLQVADTRAVSAGFQEPAPEPGFSGGDDFTGLQPGGATAGDPRAGLDMLGLGGRATAVAGALARNRDLYDFGNTIGQGVGVINAVTDPSARTLAPYALNELGVSAPVTGAIMGGLSDKANPTRGAVVGGLTSAAYAASPVLAAADILGQFGQAAFGVPAGERVSLGNLGRQAYDYVGSNLSAGAQYGVTPFGEQGRALAEQERGLPDANPTTGFSGRVGDVAVGGPISANDVQGISLDAPTGDGANAGSGGFSGMSNQGEGGFGSMGGWKDGGMVGDMPGITQRYMDGGPVQGQPLLAMGYADGGMMGQMGGQPTPAVVNKQVDAMLRDPRARQTLLARPQQLMASGELTPDEVTTMGRVAEAAMFSPELYPQLRQFVAAQGMTPLPAAFDPSVIMRIMAIARGLQSETPAGQVPGTDQAQMQRPVPGEGNGGYLQGPGTGRSDSIGTVNETTGEPVKVANGEYVIPAHVVRAKGREFFDNLLRRYSDVPKGE
ncbi:hypothetical protein K0U83_16730 [bacterium]|nr:hypothetical protein [bacterium]